MSTVSKKPGSANITHASEPNPAPDLLIAQALLHTQNIRLGPGGYTLLYHHPVDLVHRFLFLDQIFRRAREPRRCGRRAADGSIRVRNKHEINQAMLRESLDIMIRLFSPDLNAFEIKGKYFTAQHPERHGEHYAHVKPLQQPHAPIAMADAFSTESESLAF
jgi:alkanesulfonate monooxygenase SsuD/methylene tetrahydromethanopterin reductase-like flavin-dependent oxidoreductase (luciferase family)